MSVDLHYLDTTIEQLAEQILMAAVRARDEKGYCIMAPVDTSLAKDAAVAAISAVMSRKVPHQIFVKEGPQPC